MIKTKGLTPFSHTTSHIKSLKSTLFQANTTYLCIAEPAAAATLVGKIVRVTCCPLGPAPVAPVLTDCDPFYRYVPTALPGITSLLALWENSYKYLTHLHLSRK